jgi:hypothetical protein
MIGSSVIRWSARLNGTSIARQDEGDDEAERGADHADQGRHRQAVDQRVAVEAARLQQLVVLERPVAAARLQAGDRDLGERVDHEEGDQHEHHRHQEEQQRVAGEDADLAEGAAHDERSGCAGEAPAHPARPGR